MSNPIARSPFEKIDYKIGRMLDHGMAILTDALVLIDKREKLHQVRFENLAAQVLLWKHRAAAHKAHHTMKKRKLVDIQVETTQGVRDCDASVPFKAGDIYPSPHHPQRKGRAERLHREGGKS